MLKKFVLRKKTDTNRIAKQKVLYSFAEVTSLYDVTLYLQDVDSYRTLSASDAVVQTQQSLMISLHDTDLPGWDQLHPLLPTKSVTSEGRRLQLLP